MRGPARSGLGGCPIGFTNRTPTALTELDCKEGDAAIAVAVVCYADADRDTYAPACGASANFVRSCAWNGGNCQPQMQATRACR